MTDKPSTPGRTLTRARGIAQEHGLRYVYTGNVHDVEGGTTFCQVCRAPLIKRDWYLLKGWDLTGDGKCRQCGTPCAGVFDEAPGDWGPRRMPVRLADYQ
jgi:pyruvate formate lyase activating enzyme